MSSSKIVVVTGCSTGGIGYHIANEFGKAGCKVYATSRRVETMDFSANPNVHSVAMDVTKQDSINNVVEKIIADEGRIDIWVNNAGIWAVAPLIDTTIEQARAIFDTNVFSILLTSKAVLPHMAKRRSGLIVTIGSVDGEIPTPFSGVYDASKAAEHAITEVLGMEARPFGVNVFLVSPGAINTNIIDNVKDFRLEPDSLYKEWEGKIIERLNVPKIMTDTWPADKFGAEIVKRALQPNPPWYWSAGGAAWKIQALKWLPRWMALSLVWRTLGEK
ncbi:oxidoreductase [Obba rivulosa]|uniref:Oxidoreductase n=1 Tax=Obba rivulosa TaxID=1052685 RepID=A0A8E2AQQ0_9APHY|nr:oxidoreductase [Obba rivulosa]